MKRYNVSLFVFLGTLFIIAGLTALMMGFISFLLNHFGYWGTVAIGTSLTFIRILCEPAFWVAFTPQSYDSNEDDETNLPT